MNSVNYDKKLEGLRGFCALNVAIVHVLGFNFFGAAHTAFYSPLMHLQFAHIAVLLFFIISGYVMGLHHLHLPFNHSQVMVYLKKRAVRLYPIYLIALLVSFGLSPGTLSVPQMAGCLFFLQDLFVHTISTNVVLWSLSYEVLYYLLFVGIWALHQRTRYHYVFLMSLGILYILTGPSAIVIKSVLTGWLFWLSGLYLAGLPKLGHDKENFKKTISYFFLLLSTFNLGTGALMIRLLHGRVQSGQINPTDLIFLPVCLLLIMDLTHTYTRYIKWLKMVTFLLPATHIFILFYFRHDILSDTNWLFGIACFGLSVLCWPLKNRLLTFEKLDPIGRISYSIYIIHFPIAIALNSYLNKYLSGTTLLVTGTAAWLLAVWLFSFLMEIVVQPHIKRYFFPKPVDLSLKPMPSNYAD
jgi:peptidoglycan/LPS O-acetylase OafA/YrhL